LGTKAAKTPEIKPFDIIHGKKYKEKPAANQFFSSLLDQESSPLLFAVTCVLAHPGKKGAWQ
jgi:hypothetical protein